jgi:adenylosuccinate lyase
VEEAEPRLAVGQLAGAVGTLSAWGAQGPELQRRLMERVGLRGVSHRSLGFGTVTVHTGIA